MEFQILDVDYIQVNDKPVIRIFGKDENEKTVCAFYEGCEPYFYAKGQNIQKLLANRSDVVRIEQVKRLLVGFRGEKLVYKITIKNPAKTPEMREFLKANGIKTYEADILFKYRFMNDLNLNGFGWVDVQNGKTVPTNTVQSDKKIQVREIKQIKKECDAPLKYMAFDIECVSLSKGAMPEAKKDPIILISIVFSKPHKGKKSVVLSTRSDPYVMAYDDEKSMLEGFVKIIDEYDPDILTGYNVNNFDIPYILERMKKCDVKPIFGRCKQKRVMARQIGPRHKIYIVGRIIVDSFEIVKHDFSLQRYGLDFVAEKLLGQQKIPVKHSEIKKLWKGEQQGFRKLIAYSRRDSVLAMELILKLNLIDKYMGLSKVAGTLLQDTLDSGETVRIENYILREFNKKGYVFPCKPDDRAVFKRSEKRKKELGGGEVLEPAKGIHSSIIVLDFKAMYPSIIQSFNICPTTKIVKEEEIDSSRLLVTPSGAKFLPKEIKQGIIPQIAEQLMKNRQKIKKELAKCSGEKRRSLDATQWALKIMANAFYGYFGYVRSRLFDLDIANAITSTGRNTILSTKDVIEKRFGYKVVYGDTDSLFVKVDETDLDKIAKIANGMARYVTDKLFGSMELEFEKVFKRFLPLTKKRYVAWKFTSTDKGWEEDMEMKGIETVRRDWCDLVSITMKNIIEIILKKNDVKSAVKYFKNVIGKLLKSEVPIKDLVITKTITKNPKNYAGIQPHVEVVKKIQSRNTGEIPGIGDRIGYIIVKGTQLLSKRAEDPVYVMENHLPIDSRYYIENQLLPPLERIFSGLGIAKSELLGNGKQIGIFEALKASRPDVPNDIVNEVGIEQLTGFICSKCSKVFPRPPLIGTCSCGGELLFSSQKGPAKIITIN